ncbi:MAG: TonB-dependent receptor plug domain-containing protein [Bacteroidota bacterium]
MEQAVPHRHEKSIATNYLYDDKEPVPPTRLPYDIEYGIPFNGRFFLGRKPMQGTLSFFQDSARGSFGIITNQDGVFKKNLLFTDTIHFWVLATNVDSRKGDVIMDTSRVRSPRLTLEPLPLDIYTATATNDVRRMNLAGVNVLPEFSLKARKILPRKAPARIIGSGDYLITSEWINERGFPDVLAAIAAKIPGCIYDPSGPSIRFMAGRFSSLSGGGAPLIVVDGVAITDPIQIISIPMRSIDHVDVSKFAIATRYGARAAAGVIEIHTKTWKNRDPNDPSFDKSRLQEIKWVGYSNTVAFASPDYGTPVNNDYYDSRATIYWSPSVTTNGKETATVSFFAADTATRYRIVVEGVTATGEPVHAEKIVEVVKGR